MDELLTLPESMCHMNESPCDKGDENPGTSRGNVRHTQSLPGRVQNVLTLLIVVVSGMMCC